MTDTNPDRRSVLKKVGTASILGASALSATGVAAGSRGRSGNGNAGRSDLEVDVNFNPNDEEQVVTFLKEIGEIPEEEKRTAALEHLNKPRAAAVTDVLESLDFELTRIDTAEAEDDASQEVSPNFYIPDWDESSATFDLAASHWTTAYDVWTWEFEVEWEHDGMERRNINLISRPETHDFSWSHNGIQNEWIQDTGSTRTNVYREHQFEWSGAGPIPSVTHNPFMEIELTGGGRASAVEVDNDV